MKQIETKPRGFQVIKISAPSTVEEFDAIALEKSGRKDAALDLAIGQVVANTILKIWRPKVEAKYIELSGEKPKVDQKKTDSAYKLAKKEAGKDEIALAKVESDHESGAFDVRIETDTNYLARMKPLVDADEKIAQTIMDEIGWVVSSPKGEGTIKPPAQKWIDLATTYLANDDAAFVSTLVSKLTSLIGREVDVTGDDSAINLAAALSEHNSNKLKEQKAAADLAAKQELGLA